MNAPLDLSIVIVSFNTRHDLENCLRALTTHPPRLAHEIVVVDNASSDGSPEAVGGRWPAVQLIEAGANLGFAAANNLGIRAARGELVLLLNSDTLAEGDAIDLLAARLREQPDVAAVGPRIVDAAGRAELSFGRMMGPFAEVRQKLLVGLQARGSALVSGWIERWVGTPAFHDWVSGACLMVRRADALAAGLLDERYFLYAEDVDFCAALRSSGKRILFEPGACIVHLRGRSRATRPEASELAYRRSQVAFYAKHHPRWLPVLRWYLRRKGRLPQD